jgi:hypothetical protein
MIMKLIEMAIMGGSIDVHVPQKGMHKRRFAKLAHAILMQPPFGSAWSSPGHRCHQ